MSWIASKFKLFCTSSNTFLIFASTAFSVFTFLQVCFCVPNNITQQFGDKILYEGVDLQLNAGEHLGLIGQNGAGKSTLIKIITGEILPDDGQIHWQKNIHKGYLDQYVEVDETLTIEEFLKTAYAKEYEKEEKLLFFTKHIARPSMIPCWKKLGNSKRN